MDTDDIDAITRTAREPFESLISRYKTQLDYAALQLRAEQKHNHRLAAAVARYRSAACEGLALLRQMTQLAADGTTPDKQPLDDTIDSVLKDIAGGDELAEPTADDSDE